jgi:hypothetical protein
MGRTDSQILKAAAEHYWDASAAVPNAGFVFLIWRQMSALCSLPLWNT